ncbi:MAG: metallophosphoesterase family protein [Lentisphaerae bacterium]|nr:metallophosphoesterase family protein [Lentisphaerota bacterium]MCP4103788.1 metallophosphoesterase family protein [Lentisphaerota bacterium]
MLFGVFGDIHANIEAFEAVLAKLKEIGCDKLVCLGDIVGYGASPRECIDLMRAENIESVKGNHDFYTADLEQERFWEVKDYAREAILWTQQELTGDHVKWLDKLPFGLRIGNNEFIHASMETVDGEYWPYIMDRNTAQFHFYLQDTPVAFCGHIHIPLLFSHNGEDIRMEMLKEKRLEKNPIFKYLVNPGAVGQPRDSDWRAAAAIYDDETGLVYPIRVEYDVKSAQKKILAAGLPSDLAERLSRGV